MNPDRQAEARVVIHIGWHKSASTFLQEGFFREVGANYQPLAAFPPGFSRPAGADGLIDLVEAQSGFDAEKLRQLLAPPAGSPSSLTIISHEEISGHPHGYALIDPFTSARNLAAAFPDAKIVAITRNQFDYILSLYCYRVAVRGHESRSLARFVSEELEAGLLNHLQYDRLIREYIRLFGLDNLLVLPMEMLRTNPQRFFDSLSAFIDCTPRASPASRAANESTRQASTLALWRAANFIFSAALKLLLLLQGQNPADHAPDKRKIYPFLRLRYRYYSFKRHWTGRVNRYFANARRIGPEDIPEKDRLEAIFAASNARLLDLGVLKWSLSEHGYAEPMRPTESDGFICRADALS